MSKVQPRREEEEVLLGDEAIFGKPTIVPGTEELVIGAVEGLAHLASRTRPTRDEWENSHRVPGFEARGIRGGHFNDSGKLMAENHRMVIRACHGESRKV
jgi:hypothetical protein